MSELDLSVSVSSRTGNFHINCPFDPSDAEEVAELRELEHRMVERAVCADATFVMRAQLAWTRYCEQPQCIRVVACAGCRSAHVANANAAIAWDRLRPGERRRGSMVLG